jgi:RNA polymerase sigma-70 factor, ECF subfamily
VDVDDLVTRLRAGEARAKRQLFEEYGEPTWRLIYRLTGDYDLAHDVVQEAFLRAFRKIHRFEGRGTLRAWLGSLALNHLRDIQRTRQRRTAEDRRMAAAIDSRVEHAAADPLMEQRVRREVERLPESHRTVLLMHDIEGFTHEEIAEVLGIAPGSSRARLSRARAMLRESLADLQPESLR